MFADHRSLELEGSQIVADRNRGNTQFVGQCGYPHLLVLAKQLDDALPTLFLGEDAG